MHVVAVITSTCHSVTVHLEMICGGAVGRGCSENVAEELRQTNAGDEGKREMMEILQRFHDSGASLSGTEAGGAAPSDLIKDAEESDLEEGAEEGLSQETLSKILAQVILFIPHEILHQRHCCTVAAKSHRESTPICQHQQKARVLSLSHLACACCTDRRGQGPGHPGVRPESSGAGCF